MTFKISFFATIQKVLLSIILRDNIGNISNKSNEKFNINFLVFCFFIYKLRASRYVKISISKGLKNKNINIKEFIDNIFD